MKENVAKKIKLEPRQNPAPLKICKEKKLLEIKFGPIRLLIRGYSEVGGIMVLVIVLAFLYLVICD